MMFDELHASDVARARRDEGGPKAKQHQHAADTRQGSLLLYFVIDFGELLSHVTLPDSTDCSAVYRDSGERVISKSLYTENCLIS